MQPMRQWGSRRAGKSARVGAVARVPSSWFVDNVAGRAGGGRARVTWLWSATRPPPSPATKWRCNSLFFFPWVFVNADEITLVSKFSVVWRSLGVWSPDALAATAFSQCR